MDRINKQQISTELPRLSTNESGDLSSTSSSGTNSDDELDEYDGEDADDEQTPKPLYEKLSRQQTMTASALSKRNSAYSVGSCKSMNRIKTAESANTTVSAQSMASDSTANSNGIMDRYVAPHILELTTREIVLLRQSWSMMINDDISTQALSDFYHKLQSEKRIGATTNTKLNVKLSQFQHLSSVPPTEKEPNGKDGKFEFNSVDNETISNCLFCTQLYENLKVMSPNLEKNFPTIRHQTYAFARIVNETMNQLENLGAMDDRLCQLGKMHSRVVGVTPPDFELMGVVFIRTLQDRFGILFTFELEELWSKLYSYLANSIILYGTDPMLRIKRKDLYSVEKESKGLEFPIPAILEPKVEKNKKNANSSPLLYEKNENVVDNKLTTVKTVSTSSMANAKRLQGRSTVIQSRPIRGSSASKKECILM